MKPAVLILTQPGDTHAYAVAEALEHKGAAVSLWHTSDFPSRDRESISFSAGKKTLHVSGIAQRRELPCFRSVWHRRPALVFDGDGLHPADRSFGEAECMAFRRALFSLLSPDALWVNNPDAAWRANRKPLQLEAAVRAGFSIPETLISNDPKRIRRFLAAQGGTAVYKTFGGYTWRHGDTHWLPFTTLLTADNLVEDHLLQAVPGIYQAAVPKSFELRVTVIGREVVAVKLHSQETSSGRVDWRRSYHDLKVETFALPQETAGQCLSLLAELGLVFGCIDLIVQPDGQTVFLEVNESGQFLFLERLATVPLLDLFAEPLALRPP